MAEDDIYGNKKKFENFKSNLNLLLLPPHKRTKYAENSKYFCINSKNLEYFRKLFNVFEVRDMSYVRRMRLSFTFKMIVAATKKDLAEIDRKCDRDEINNIVVFGYHSYKSNESRIDFIKHFKFMWKHLFPEKDEKGRVDETLVPYVVRHLKPKADKSREKRRRDKLTYEEFESIVQYFSNDAQMQFYLTFANESLVRPQEACYIHLQDVQLHDNYAKIYLSEHGKEGVHGFLRCIDSFPYLMSWLEKHPLRNKEDAFLLVTEGRKNRGSQQSPHNLNRRIRNACKKLGINKPITAYSLKRNGVSFKRLAGYSDAEIQHIARWTSTKQLQTYDLTDADDTFKIALMRKGLISVDEKHKAIMPELKKCGFCGKQNAFTNFVCENCKRPLDRSRIIEEEKKKESEISELKSQMEELKLMVMQIAKKEIVNVEKVVV